jgi:hypothetical protein
VLGDYSLLRPAGSFLFISSWFMRWSNATAPVMTAMMLGWIGILVALFASWLGGELVYRLNVGVDLGATLYAPNSLSGRSALGAPSPSFYTWRNPCPIERSIRSSASFVFEVTSLTR